MIWIVLSVIAVLAMIIQLLSLFLMHKKTTMLIYLVMIIFFSYVFIFILYEYKPIERNLAFMYIFYITFMHFFVLKLYELNTTNKK